MEGCLVIVSGPSGAGKGTVVKRLLQEMEEAVLSVSCTTRVPREGEVNGREYFFVTEEIFRSMIDQKEFLEYAYVHGLNYYGTPRPFVLEQIEKGRIVILEIDVEGAHHVKQNMPDAFSIFIQAPSLKVLEERLRGRGTESEEEIERRLETAEKELLEKDGYDAIVVNDDLVLCVREMQRMIQEYLTKN